MSSISRSGPADYPRNEEHDEAGAHQASDVHQPKHAQQARHAVSKKRNAPHKSASSSLRPGKRLPKALQHLKKSGFRGGREEESGESRSRRVRRSRDGEQGKQDGSDHDEDGVETVAVKRGKRAICPPVAGHLQKLGADFADQPARLRGIIADQYAHMIAEVRRALERNPDMPVAGPVLDLQLDLLMTRLRYGLTGSEGGEEAKRAVVRLQSAAPGRASQSRRGQVSHDRSTNFNLLQYLIVLHGNRPLPQSLLAAAEARVRGQRSAYRAYSQSAGNASQKP